MFCRLVDSSAPSYFSCSRIREELLTVREELHKTCLSHDLLEQQKLEADTLISSLEKVKLDYEHQLGHLMGESSNVQDSLVKKETIAAALEVDKKRLQDDLKKVKLENCATFSTQPRVSAGGGEGGFASPMQRPSRRHPVLTEGASASRAAAPGSGVRQGLIGGEMQISGH